LGDADGGNLKQLTHTREDESSPCWSPDGRTLFVANAYTNNVAVFSVAGGRQIGFEQAPVKQAEPLKLQLDAFLDSVETRNSPKTSGGAARQTLEVALSILDRIAEHAEVVTRTLATGWKP